MPRLLSTQPRFEERPSLRHPWALRVRHRDSARGVASHGERLAERRPGEQTERRDRVFIGERDGLFEELRGAREIACSGKLEFGPVVGHFGVQGG